MKIKIYILLSLTIISLCFSCKEEGTYYQLDEEFIEYFGYAKDGSWWVFTDITQNIRDSFYITDYRVYRQYLNEKPEGDSYQGIRYYLNSNEKKNRAELLQVPMYEESLLTNYFDYMPITGTLQNYFSFFPSISMIEDSIQVEDCNTCGIELIPNYRSNNFEFINVIKVWRNMDTFYIAPRTGLIQFHEDDNDFFLLDYYINE